MNKNIHYSDAWKSVHAYEVEWCWMEAHDDDHKIIIVMIIDV